MTKRKQMFDALRAFAPDGQIPVRDIPAIDGLADRWELDMKGKAQASAPVTRPTERIMLEIVEHEAIVCEAYKDSAGVLTWGVGVTDASGHHVERYKDNPVSIQRCLEVYEWLIRTKYLPSVLRAFEGYPLTEAELGAALSFHWNTGGIGRADWVKSVKAGKMDQARREMLNWVSPREIIGRRKAERALFFDGAWSSDGLVTLYQRVRKPSYAPDWGSAKQVDIRPALAEVMKAAGV